MKIELHQTTDLAGSRPFCCPTCGQSALVVPRAPVPPGSALPVTLPFWLMTECSGFCGRVSRKRNELVELLPAGPPPAESLAAHEGALSYPGKDRGTA